MARKEQRPKNIKIVRKQEKGVKLGVSFPPKTFNPTHQDETQALIEEQRTPEVSPEPAPGVIEEREVLIKPNTIKSSIEATVRKKPTDGELQEGTKPSKDFSNSTENKNRATQSLKAEETILVNTKVEKRGDEITWKENKIILAMLKS